MNAPLSAYPESIEHFRVPALQAVGAECEGFGSGVRFKNFAVNASRQELIQRVFENGVQPGDLRRRVAERSDFGPHESALSPKSKSDNNIH